MVYLCDHRLHFFANMLSLFRLGMAIEYQYHTVMIQKASERIERPKL